MRERFTDEEWDTLLFAPHFAYYGTAMSDDEVIDRLESKAMFETLASNMKFSQDELTREVCHTLVHDYDAVHDRMKAAEGTAILDVIIAAGRLADRVGAPAYKQLIVDICEATANASDPLAGPDPSARDAKLAMVRDIKYRLDPVLRDIFDPSV